jgi:tripartite-type tricarboxylate transporter receptor subunit TctC
MTSDRVMFDRIVLLSAVTALCAGVAQGEGFPSKPVRIVVPYPISGPTDIRGTARMTKTYKLIAQHTPPAISDTLATLVVQAIRSESSYPVLLERQPGGITTRGAMRVARSAADGHTLLLASNATMIIIPNFFYGVEYDPMRDFVLVAPLATMPFVLMMNSSLPADNIRQLAAWLKVRPGEINYGSSGDGSTGHLAGELFRRAIGVPVVHVSYNGGLAALNGVATGQVSYMFAALPLALPYLSHESIQALGITGAKRHVRLPELATLSESGFPGLDIEAWYGIFAHARTPASTIVWLNEHIAAAIAEPATRSYLVALGLEPATVSLGQFATRINSESEKWAPVVRASRLPVRDGA